MRLGKSFSAFFASKAQEWGKPQDALEIVSDLMYQLVPQLVINKVVSP
jgi:hypothetical protein